MEKVKSRMEYRKYKTSNAITLIALIITIIIMLILLAVTISILVKSNIIGIAESAADKTKTAYEKESILGSKVTIDGIEYNSIEEYQKQKNCTHEWIETIKEANCCETGMKKETCTKCGKVVEEIIAKTSIHIIKNGICIICGQEHELLLGATIVGYDPSVGQEGIINTSYISEGAESGGTETTDGSVGNGYTNRKFTVKSITEWQMLGEEDGQIIIIPKGVIISDDQLTRLGFYGQAGYMNMIEELDKISSIYGQGKYADTEKYSLEVGNETIASGGRSIRLEDIEKGYNQYSTLKTKKYSNSGSRIYCDGKSTTATTFIYWGEDAIPSEGAEWKTLKSGESVIISERTFIPFYSSSSELYDDMLFGDYDPDAGKYWKRYWLATKNFAATSTLPASSGMSVWNGGITDETLVTCDGVSLSGSDGIRPVVYLDTDILLSYNAETQVYAIIESEI